MLKRNIVLLNFAVSDRIARLISAQADSDKLSDYRSLINNNKAVSTRPYQTHCRPTCAV